MGFIERKNLRSQDLRGDRDEPEQDSNIAASHFQGLLENLVKFHRAVDVSKW